MPGICADIDHKEGWLEFEHQKSHYTKFQSMQAAQGDFFLMESKRSACPYHAHLVKAA